MALTGRSVVWVDSAGRTRQTILRSDGTSAAVVAALIGASNADVEQTFEGLLSVTPIPAPLFAQYPNVADYAVLNYTDGTDLIYVTLPAPQSAVFLADQETVDATAIAALSGAIIGTLVTGPGNAVTTFVGGTRRRAGKEYQ